MGIPWPLAEIARAIICIMKNTARFPRASHCVSPLRGLPHLILTHAARVPISLSPFYRWRDSGREAKCPAEGHTASGKGDMNLWCSSGALTFPPHFLPCAHLWSECASERASEREKIHRLSQLLWQNLVTSVSTQYRARAKKGVGSAHSNLTSRWPGL